VIGRIWRALVAAAPVRLWAQILGFGTVIGVIVYVLHSIFGVINSGAQPLEVVLVLAKGLVSIALGLIVLAIIEAVAITELKLGLTAGKDGLHLDAQRDDEHEPHTLAVSGEVTVTPQAPKGDA
jgi:hypothetical protein